jgi:hypothetical protein
MKLIHAPPLGEEFLRGEPPSIRHRMRAVNGADESFANYEPGAAPVLSFAAAGARISDTYAFCEKNHSVTLAWLPWISTQELINK